MSCCPAEPVEGRKGHVHGAVADGMQGELEAGPVRPPHGMRQLFLLPLHGPARGGIVGIRLDHRRRVSAERPVEIGLQSVAADHRVRRGETLPQLLRCRQVLLEPRPRADPGRETPLLVKLPERLQSAGRGQLMNGGHTVQAQLAQSGLERFAPLRGRWRRHVRFDEARSGLLEDPCRLA